MGNLIYVTGYGRSGNTFLQIALQKMYSKVIVSDHNHNSLYFVNRLGSNVVIPIRNPLDSVASYYSFLTYNKVTTTIDKCLENYIDYFSKIQHHKDKLCLLDFNKMTTDLTYIENQIENKYGCAVDKKIDIKEVEQEMTKNHSMFFYTRSEAKASQKIKQQVLDSNYYNQALTLWGQNK